MKREIRPIDANALAAKIREYMADYPHAETRLAACRALLSMLGDEKQTPTILQPTCNNIATSEQLTIDQLREVPHGKIKDSTLKSICDRANEIAFSPAHIDRDAWKPCGECKNREITVHVPEFRAMAVCNQHMDHAAFDLTLRPRFCPWCGRPLTEEAWAELVKRLRG